MLNGDIDPYVWLENKASLMEARSFRGVELLCLGGLSLFVVGFVVVVIARGWGT